MSKRKPDAAAGAAAPQSGGGGAAKLLVPAALGVAALLGRLLLRRGAASADDEAYTDAPAQPAPVQLEWRDVRCTLARKQKRGERRAAQPAQLLQGISGSAAPGRLLAILGPSGAGKTCVARAWRACACTAFRIGLR
jgi:ABC-type glutathione transport system ATPase component